MPDLKVFTGTFRAGICIEYQLLTTSHNGREFVYLY